MDKIKAPISNELKEFQTYFRSTVKNQGTLLNVLTNYTLKQKGKQIRPIITFLSAQLHGTINSNTYTAASLIELLHTATLIHDDVVDETLQRRGVPSINAIWKNKIAVLLGDYFFSKGLLLATEKKQCQLLQTVSQAVKEMSEGELLQIQKTQKLDIDEKTYFDIIYKKTASLIRACTTAGTQTTTTDEQAIKQMAELGKNIGMAFQIKDDLFDYTQTNFIGKPTGNDLKEKKITLPLIHTLSTLPPKEKKHTLNTIKKHHKNSKKMNPIIKLVNQNGSIQYTIQKMNEYAQKAYNILDQYPNTPTKKSLQKLIEYTMNRKK